MPLHRGYDNRIAFRAGHGAFLLPAAPVIRSGQAFGSDMIPAGRREFNCYTQSQRDLREPHGAGKHLLAPAKPGTPCFPGPVPLLRRGHLPACAHRLSPAHHPAQQPGPLPSRTCGTTSNPLSLRTLPTDRSKSLTGWSFPSSGDSNTPDRASLTLLLSGFRTFSRFAQPIHRYGRANVQLVSK